MTQTEFMECLKWLNDHSASKKGKCRPVPEITPYQMLTVQITLIQARTITETLDNGKSITDLYSDYMAEFRKAIEPSAAAAIRFREVLTQTELTPWQEFVKAFLAA